MRTVLVTGFEPFGGETVNASWEVARALHGRRCGDAVARALMLPCAYDACVAEFVEAFERLKPDAVLLTGQAARRAVVSVERFAHDRASATHADNRGVVRGGFASPLVGEAGTGVATRVSDSASPEATASGPARPIPAPQDVREPRLYLETTADVGAIAHAIRAVGVPARVSNDAGDYVCNHLYHGALKHLAVASPSTPAVFLHVPATPEQTPARANPRRLTTIDAARALVAAVVALAG